MSLFSVAYLLFLFIVVLFYFLIPKRWQWLCLLVASYSFYIFSSSDNAVIVYIIVTTVVTFWVGILVEKIQSNYILFAKENRGILEKNEILKKKEEAIVKKRIFIVIALVINIGILARLKYAGFVVEQINVILHRMEVVDTISIVELALPLGISFYTFQSIGYLIDIYRGKVVAEKNILRFALFVSYFPQIIQGPISRHNQLANELYKEHFFDYARIKSGILRMVWGYFKVLVIANRAAVIVDEVFANYQTEKYAGFIIFFAVLLYGIQIYADFSGGIDIIIGTSEIFGIELTENFRQPFSAKSVSEFWQRWHMTLGSWMKDYLFYPLAMSKFFTKFGKFLKRRIGRNIGKILPTCIASFIVFFLVGVWHGAEWKYIVFGLYQAVFVSSATLLDGMYIKLRKIFHVNEMSSSWQIFASVRTLFIITIGRYLSRATDLSSAIEMLKATFSKFNPWIFFDETLFELGLDRKNFYILIICILILFAVDMLHEKGIRIRKVLEKQDIVIRWTIYYLSIFSIILFGYYGIGFATKLIYQGF